jgi:hypothetical protein
MKGALTLVGSVVTSIAFSVTSRRFDQPEGKWIFPACIGAVFFVLQFGLVMAKSKEDIELAEFKRIQSAENERDAVEIENGTRTANATTERILREIESGNLEDAERWTDFLKGHHGKGK